MRGFFISIYTCSVFISLSLFCSFFQWFWIYSTRNEG